MTQNEHRQRTIFGPKLAAILDFESLGDQETIFE